LIWPNRASSKKERLEGYLNAGDIGALPQSRE
jgi:hypothetical protein